MHFLGGLLLVIVIFWLATRVAGPKAGVGAAAVTTVALMMLNSDSHHHHHQTGSTTTRRLSPRPFLICPLTGGDHAPER